MGDPTGWDESLSVRGVNCFRILLYVKYSFKIYAVDYAIIRATPYMWGSTRGGENIITRYMIVEKRRGERRSYEEHADKIPQERTNASTRSPQCWHVLPLP
jgi:hypothetical protein